MSNDKQRVSNQRPGSNFDYDKADIPRDMGIYVGVVQNVDKESRSGRLEVYVSLFGANDPTEQQSRRVVTYASPFMGTTTGTGSQYTSAGPNDNTFLKTQIEIIGLLF